MRPTPRLRRVSALGLLLGCAAGCDGVRPIADPIPQVPMAQQRVVTRHDFETDWPFTVGEGVMGCAAGAVFFRAGGVTYALGDPTAQGPEPVAPIAAIQRVQGTGPPSHPLGRLRQDVRMRVFRAAMECERASSGAALADCRREVCDAAQVTEAELVQVEAEGRERVWPPLSPTPASLESVIHAAQALCPAGQGRGR